MNGACTITDFYRQIGNVFRQYGAEKVVLLKAKRKSAKKNAAEDSWQMHLEIAADGCLDSEKLQLECRKLWPQTEITILNLNDDENLGLEEEVVEDGILL